MKLLTMQLSPSSYQFIPFGYKRSPRHPVTQFAVSSLIANATFLIYVRGFAE
jgi:hypothetical protein